MEGPSPGESAGQGGVSMTSPYKRRKPSILRNFWVYRRLVLVALVLGLLLWFIWANNEKVTVAFPFRLGQVSSSLGIVILSSALVGSVATLLVTTMYLAIRSRRASRPADSSEKGRPDDDLPPPDYAAKTGDGLSGSRWP
jgi:uncharacterized integral membrane protein